MSEPPSEPSSTAEAPGPTSMAELNEQAAANVHTSGYGIEGVRQHLPCPFCAFPEVVVFKIIEVEAALAQPHTCARCGRSFKVVVERSSSGSKTFEFVQTGGPAQPEWFKPKMRVVEAT